MAWPFHFRDRSSIPRFELSIHEGIVMGTVAPNVNYAQLRKVFADNLAVFERARASGQEAGGDTPRVRIDVASIGFQSTGAQGKSSGKIQ